MRVRQWCEERKRDDDDDSVDEDGNDDNDEDSDEFYEEEIESEASYLSRTPEENYPTEEAVSYTHLTLPTKRIV